MFNLSRLFIAYAIAALLALLLGVLVVWFNPVTFVFLSAVLFLFAVPLILKWHHFWLVALWNAAFNAFFLPGQPEMWLPIGVLSFAVSFLNHVMFQKRFLHAPEFTRPLLFMAGVVLVTAWVRGGIGVRALGGGSFGGRYYYYVLGAIIGYFAFAAESIPLQKARRYCNVFFLSSTTAGLSNIVFLLGPAFYFLYLLIPSGYATSQAAASVGKTSIERITALSTACVCCLCFLLANYGIRGIFDPRKPWRIGFLFLILVGAFFSGYRSSLLMLALVFGFQFYLERLMNTHYLPIIVGLAICGFIPVALFSESMPPAVQRAVSFLPVKVDTDILEEAKGSTEWRLRMWKEVWKTEVPKYLFIGKGYAIDPFEITALYDSERMGLPVGEFEGSMLAEDFHSGPLSVLVPFGIPGVIGFLWILYGGYRLLVLNYRFGDPKLRKINTLLLAYYLTNCISFFFIFGALSTGLCVFTGLCGLSVSLNGGVRRRFVPKPKQASARSPLALQPG